MAARGPQDSIELDQARNVACAVWCYLARPDHDHPDDAIHPRALTARALSGLGYAGLARRMLLHDSDVFRNTEWTVTGDDSVCMLDLSKLLGETAVEILELTLFATISALLQSIAEGWDETSGRGYLGLRHVRLAAARVMGGSRPGGNVLPLCAEIRDRCGEKLAQLARQRDWESVPRILLLDL